ncbi:hypothetical protein [Haladaptatus sp. DYSN1]|uniref:hypothetical protein n=1 Tax=unclassified Haladaptatus TaxID=2622732 RepID=UPI0024054596|nr:hypothetical protein [Haladaptatus sp. DYSN1]
MSPTRRSLLRVGGLTAVGLLAGCVANGGGPADNDTTEPGNNTTDDSLLGPGNQSDDPAGGTRPAGTGGPGVTVVHTDDQPALPLEVAIAVTNEAATDDAPPQLEVSVTNTSERSVKVGEGRAIIFQYAIDDREQLQLLPAGEAYPTKKGCWRLTDGIAITEEYRIRTIEAGKTVTEKLDVYALKGGDGCLPVGTFDFETTYTVMNEKGEEQKQDRWGFTIAME